MPKGLTLNSATSALNADGATYTISPTATTGISGIDYFKSAFGDFAPNRDEDASVKFVLNAVVMDNRLPELAAW
ncbi:hypothetical protein FHS28_004612 [Roseateles terrae]|uniref:Uncharacterized protein n=1 Tax=Roseateles terrae TaxID=431060 RepID=A0ABR6GZU1_9BURK|nr:hypothetical protein [Roseateles terrae]